MHVGRRNVLLRHIRRLTGGDAVRDLSDRQLLARFVDQQDEGAFAELVQRHGSLVRGVCRRVLQHEHDAEDAFQATFLVLVRKAPRLRWQNDVGPWLYQVAYRTSLKVRGRNVRRLRQESEAGAARSLTSIDDMNWREARQLLDEEMNQLPEKYRATLVLCCLEGKTRDEAAEQLGWTAGAVKGRLERGRELLRRRLETRGLTFSVAMMAALLGQSALSAAVPQALASATARAALQFVSNSTIATSAVTLAQGVLYTMFLGKLKTAAVVVLMLVLATTGIGLAAHRVAGGRTSEGTERVADDAAKKPERPSEQRPVRADETGADKARREEKKEPPPVVKEVVATLVGFDSASNRVSVTLREGKEESYELVRDAVVVVDGKEGNLVDVPEKTSLTLHLSAEDRKVHKVVAEGPRIAGTFKELGRDRKTITIQGGGRNGNTFDVRSDLKAIWPPSGQRPVPEIRLETLRPGQAMTVVLTVDKKRIARIVLHRGHADVVGHVASIDSATGSVLLRPAREGGEDKRFDLSADPWIRIDGGKEGKLTDLGPGCLVELKMDSTTRQVVEVWATGPPMHVNLHQVDAAKRTISILERKEVRTFAVPLEARIAGPNERDRPAAEIKFEELKVGQRAELLLSADGKSVVAITLARR